jgi:hypothetical protein
LDCVKCARPKQFERQYRVGIPRFLPNKGREEQHAYEQRNKDYFISPARNWCCHQAEDKGPKRNKREQRTTPIQTAFGFGVAALGHAIEAIPIVGIASNGLTRKIQRHVR